MSILKTGRLSLEKIEPEDEQFIFELMTSPTWLKNIGDRGIKQLSDAGNFIKNKFMPSYSKYGLGFYKVVLTGSGTPVGICGFIKRDELEFPDVGYAILPEYEGLGITSEALLGTMKYGYEVLSLTTICGVTSEDNIVSQHLLEKAGLKKTGMVKLKNEDHEILLFSNGR